MHTKWFWLLAALAALSLLVNVVACDSGDDDDDSGDAGDDDDDDEFVVLSVQPGTGPVAGGTPVIVYGRAFEDGCKLYFGDSEADSVTFSSSTELSANTPPSPAGGNGAVTVKVENPGGEFAELENGFYYGEPGVEIDWCAIRWPEATQTAPGVPSEPIYGHVFVEGCTEEQGSACESITMQVGHGEEGIDPSVDESLFTWTDAAYNPDFAPIEGDESYNNDEFMATITEDEEGVYKYAYRVSGDGGATWTYCDWGVGTDDGFSPSTMGTLTVAEVQYTIGWCVLQYPPSTQTEPGTATEGIYGRVFVEGCTDGDQFCSGVLAQVGWGDRGADPSASPGDYEWTNASYNNDHVEDNNDEYQTPIVEDTEGNYAYAYRFSGDGGASWVYCDLDGSSNGFQTDQMGALTVGEQELEVGWCNLHWPAETTTILGNPTENIYGRVYVADETGTGTPSGSITGQAGFGPQDTDPSGYPGAYTWEAAAFNISDGNNDEYAVQMDPDTLGDYAYAYRFSVDGGSSWTYCDLNGSSDGVSTDQLGTLHVVEQIVAPIGWCNLQYPSETTTVVGVATELIYGQVFVDGYTGTGEDSGIVQAQLGYATQGSNPTTNPGDFDWSPAAFNVSVDNNDEYATSITPGAAGTYGYAYRFSTDGGLTWEYCDLDGGLTGDFTLAQMGALFVNDSR